MAAQITWLGVDSSAWNLSTGNEHVYLLDGLAGIGDPPFQAFWQERLGDGDRYRGTRLTRREAILKVGVGAGLTGLTWRAVDRAWWQSWSRDRFGVLTFYQEDLSRRHLHLRLARQTDHVFDFDPGEEGGQEYVIAVVAEQPLWSGDDVTTTWSFAAGGEDFYGGVAGGGFGPPYVLSPSNGFGETLVTNAGDVPAWPRFEVSGPMAAATITVDGHNIDLPAGVPAGQSRYVLTDPPEVYGGFLEPRWNEMTGAVDFAPVPVGGTVPVTVSVSSPSAGAFVKMTITPRYERPW